MRFKIHPAIGIARVGDSPDGFYIAPEQAGQLPYEPSDDGSDAPITTFKDAQQRVKRQAARFRLYSYDDDLKQGKEVQVGDVITTVWVRSGQSSSGQLATGEVVDIEWTAYLANKKASWYEFEQLDGEHGYSSGHKLRNSDVKDADARQQLIIDPGPQTVSHTDKKQRTAQFAKGQNPGYTQSFPPPLAPNSIDTLGELRAIRQGQHLRLLVLGGHGNSGSYKKGFGQPVITNYANNDGWFDDVSDGPVMARVKYKILSLDGRPPDPLTEKKKYFYADVEFPAWCIVGYPRYAPQVMDIVTMDEAIYDVAVREFGYDTYMYGTPPFSGQPPPDPADAKALARWREDARWNPDYYPYFYRDIWPILMRPQNFQWVFDIDQFAGGAPHDPTPGVGNFDPNLLSVVPYEGQDPDQQELCERYRNRIWWALRKPGQENFYQFANDPAMSKFFYVLMPFLCGDNPISNTLVSKFLRLTDTQLFILGQWAQGKFINEHAEEIKTTVPEQATGTGRDLDRGVLSNLLGGSFCPGGEATWIVRNPAIYAEPYRIKHSKYFSLVALNSWQTQPLTAAGTDPDPADAGMLSTGLEPGDITKYSGVPWQSDFNECSTQAIDITYEKWNETDLQSVGDPAKQVLQTTYWWPAHRPMEVNNKQGAQVAWSQGIPQTHAGDLKMVTAWKELGFIMNIGTDDNPNLVQVERNDANI
ncbi:MAG: LodA/GoxA family CTQ-dependent oxidase [Pyrinomonadaceae bacterium]